MQTVGETSMSIRLGNSEITEQVFIVKGATNLLLVVPAIRNLGLVHDISNSYSIRA